MLVCVCVRVREGRVNVEVSKNVERLQTKDNVRWGRNDLGEDEISERWLQTASQ